MAQQVTRRTAWLTRTPSPTARARLFCIPYAGCGAGLFRNWPRETSGVEFLPVELPGRETRLAEPPPESFQAMATSMIDALAPYFDLPFAFFGHCWSALAAYEVTLQIERATSWRPARLFVSSQVPPQEGPVGRLLDMTDADLSAELASTIRALGGEPHPQLLSIYVDVLRSDVAVSRRYEVPAPHRLDCPITAMGWTDDSEVTPAQMTGWTECGQTSFELFSGQHRRFIDAPPELLRTLSTRLISSSR